MKKFNISTVFLGILAVGVLSLTACDKKNDDASPAQDSRARGAVPTANANTVGPGIQVTSVNYSTGISDPQLFENNVKDFLAAGWDSSGVGTITDQSVIIATNLDFSAAGQINAANTRLRIWVTDSLALQRVPVNGGVAQPYFIAFDSTTAAITGSRSGARVTVTFRDSLQEVTLDANRANDGVYYGTLAFKNLKDASNGQLKSASPMGYFKTATGIQ